VLASTGVVRRTLPLILLALLVLPAVASASGRDVIRNCEEYGELTKSFSKGELRAAKRGLPTDLKEYSNCEALIDDALTRLARKRKPSQPSSDTGANSSGTGGQTGGNGGGSTPSAGTGGEAATAGGLTVQTAQSVAPAFAQPTPAEEDAAAHARTNKPVDLGVGTPVAPSSATALHRGISALPPAVRALLAGLALAALVALVVALRRAAGGLRRPA
jgi:hypothetical protein